MVGFGAAGQGLAGMVCRGDVGRVEVSQGMAGKAWHGLLSWVLACLCKAWQACFGMRGTVRRGLARQVWQVVAKYGWARRGMAWQAWQARLWHGLVVRGEGVAWHREVWEVNPYGRSHVMAAYKWKAGSRIKLDAQTAGEVCGELEKEGRLAPAELVETSRDEAAPLHGAFEWRDEIAAEKYREVQAGHIIRSLEVVITGTSEPVRAFFPVSIVGEARCYTRTETILRDESARATLLERALAELEAFKRKYKTLGELADVFAAIDGVAQ